MGVGARAPAGPDTATRTAPSSPRVGGISAAPSTPLADSGGGGSGGEPRGWGAAAFARRPSPASASRKKRVAIGILDESAHDEVSTVHSAAFDSRFRRGVESM